MDSYPTAALVALDWGTSSCRAYLLREDGHVLALRESDDGVMQVGETARAEGIAREQAFDDVLVRLCADWADRSPEPALPVIASGMVGSDQGWAHVPYVELPVDLLASPPQPHPVESSLGTVHIVPGLVGTGALPGVIRGEETQIIGVLLEEGEAAAPPPEADRVMVLPGTHSKWVHLRGGTVLDFSTHMSGEIFALTMRGSILARLHTPSENPDWNAYDRGLETALGHEGRLGLLGLLFSARSLVLTGQLEETGVGDYVSGLVIGSEVAHMARHWLPRCDGRQVDLVGNSSLCTRYARALDRAGVAVRKAGPHATPRALAHVAGAAGLLATSTTTRGPQ